MFELNISNNRSKSGFIRRIELVKRRRASLRAKTTEGGCPTFKMILIPWLRIVPGRLWTAAKYVTGIRSKPSRLSCLHLLAVAKNSIAIEAFCGRLC